MLFNFGVLQLAFLVEEKSEGEEGKDHDYNQHDQSDTPSEAELEACAGCDIEVEHARVGRLEISFDKVTDPAIVEKFLVEGDLYLAKSWNALGEQLDNRVNEDSDDKPDQKDAKNAKVKGIYVFREVFVTQPLL